MRIPMTDTQQHVFIKGTRRYPLARKCVQRKDFKATDFRSYLVAYITNVQSAFEPT